VGEASAYTRHRLSPPLHFRVCFGKGAGRCFRVYRDHPDAVIRMDWDHTLFQVMKRIRIAVMDFWLYFSFVSGILFDDRIHHTKFTKNSTKTRKPIRLGYRRLYVVPPPSPTRNFRKSTKFTKRGTGAEEWKEIKCEHQEMYGWFFSCVHIYKPPTFQIISHTPNPFFLIWGAGPRLRRGAARGGVSYFLGPLYVSK